MYYFLNKLPEQPAYGSQQLRGLPKDYNLIEAHVASGDAREL
jgi:hypothetical protein